LSYALFILLLIEMMNCEIRKYRKVVKSRVRYIVEQIKKLI